MKYWEMDLLRQATRSATAQAAVSFLRLSGSRRMMYDTAKVSRRAKIDAPVEFSIQLFDKMMRPATAEFRIDPSSSTPITGRRGIVKWTFKHRVHIRCADCGAWIPTGRFHQHAGSRKCLEAQR